MPFLFPARVLSCHTSFTYLWLMMKALVLEAKNVLPNCTTVEAPIANRGQTLVALSAASLNHRDVWIMKGQYPSIRFPLILGSDGAGVSEGREIVIQPGIGWGADERYQTNGYQILGLPQNGTFAEQVVVDRSQLFPKPIHLNMEQAAGLPLAGLTAYRVLFSRCKARAPSTTSSMLRGVGGDPAAVMRDLRLTR